MSGQIKFRSAIIIIAIAIAGWLIYPTVQYHFLLSQNEIERLKEDGELKMITDRIIQQGLDLQGGLRVVLEIDIPELLNTQARRHDEKLDTIIDSLKSFQNSNRIVTVDIFDFLTTKVEEVEIKLPLYFAGEGASNEEVIASFKRKTKDAASRALTKIRNRVDKFGVSEPSIQPQGDYRIIVELAGVDNPNQARQLINSRALLEFSLLKDAQYITDTIIPQIDNAISEDETVLQETETPEDSLDAESLFAEENETFAGLAVFNGTYCQVSIEDTNTVKQMLEKATENIPRDIRVLWGSKERSAAGDLPFIPLYFLEKKSALTGEYITNVNVSSDPGTGSPIVNMQMNNEGAKKWGRITEDNKGKPLAIVLDDFVYSAPVIRNKIPNGRSQIEGIGTMEEANILKIALETGALPAPIREIAYNEVGPSLGSDSIKKGQTATLVGLLLVIVFMAVYYRGSGFIADFALVLNLLIILAALAAFDATLTLPGIAGLVLTVGMAIDANVLIFERIKEELRLGKTVRESIRRGYERALQTIMDANITTLIAAVVLMKLGTGPVKGFAVTLSIGILASLFTAVYVTRTIFMMIAEKKQLQSLSI